MCYVYKVHRVIEVKLLYIWYKYRMSTSVICLLCFKLLFSPIAFVSDRGFLTLLNLHLCKSYRNDQQDATVQDNLLFHCSLTAQHVSSDIIAHYQEILNCNYSFRFNARLSLPATTNVCKTRNCNYTLEAPDNER